MYKYPWKTLNSLSFIDTLKSIQLFFYIKVWDFHRANYLDMQVKRFREDYVRRHSPQKGEHLRKSRFRSILERHLGNAENLQKMSDEGSGSFRKQQPSPGIYTMLYIYIYIHHLSSQDSYLVLLAIISKIVILQIL